jgi:hypothetical protein
MRLSEIRQKCAVTTKCAVGAAVVTGQTFRRTAGLAAWASTGQSMPAIWMLVGRFPPLRQALRQRLSVEASLSVRLSKGAF